MISTRWLNQRTPHWQRLEGLLDAAGRGGIRTLGRSDLQALGRLYRQIAADLATVREDPGSARFAAYLNHLLTRAHHTIYSADRPSASGFVQFITTTFPQACRDLAWHCLVASLLFAIAGLAGAALTWHDPDFTLKLLGPEMVETIQRREMWTHSIVGMKPYASSAIMTNNMSVAFMTFASGILGGLGTIYFLLFNGLLIGVIGAACASAGMSLPLWSFVAPHGVLELPAIFIAGGAGLRLGTGLLFPGFLPRRTSVVLAGGQAVRLILGCVPILIIAGVIEAFVSPTELAIGMKFAMAAALFVLFAMYLMSGRRERAVASEPREGSGASGSPRVSA